MKNRMRRAVTFIAMLCSAALWAVDQVLASGAAAGVPEPQPVKSSVEITALYYPGTEHMPEWDMVKQVVPQARPLLGWYDEGDPANVEIDWMRFEP